MIKGKLAHIIEKNRVRSVFQDIFDVNKAFLFETRKSSVLFPVPVYSSQIKCEKYKHSCSLTRPFSNGFRAHTHLNIRIMRRRLENHLTHTHILRDTLPIVGNIVESRPACTSVYFYVNGHGNNALGYALVSGLYD